MTVSGIPQLTLETGANDAVVDYASGTDSNTLTFTYTVGAGQTSSDLDYASTGALALNSGSILDPAGNASTLTLADPGAAGSLGANKALVIDTTAPTIEVVTEVTTPSNDTTPSYVFTTNETGTVTTNIVAGIGSGGTVTSTGENTVTFTALDPGTYADKTITVTDAAGNASSLTLVTFVIDTTAPTAAITYDSTSPYKNGDTVVITATFNGPVADSPVPTIAIAGSGIANVTSTNMTKSSTTVYTYSYAVPTVDGTGTVTVGSGEDGAGNVFSSSAT
jgi:hypothetical protein